MAQVFRTGFGSKSDSQACHQATVRKLVAHLDSNCKTSSARDVVRRAEMIIVLQHTVDKLLNLDAGTILERPAFLADNSI